MFLELEFAIYANVLLSLMLYLSRTAHPRIINLAPNPDTPGQCLNRSQAACPQLKIGRIDGSLFFGAADHVAEFLQGIDKNSTYKCHVLIIASGINFIDVAGAEMLTNESQRRRRLRGGLYICGLKQGAREILRRGDYLDIIGNDNIFTSETEAISKICSRLDTIECHQCQTPLFQECKALFDSENRQ